MYFVTLNSTGSLVFDLPQRPDASSITASLYTPSGGSLAGATVALDSVNTGLTLAVSSSTVALVVASATGMAVGRRYLLDGSEDTAGEWVTVRTLSGTTVTPLHPPVSSHASGSTLQSARVTVTVPAATTTPVGRHYRCELSWQVSGSNQAPYVATYDVVRYTPVSYLTREDVGTIDPTFIKKIPSGWAFQQVKQGTWDEMLQRIASTVAPGSLVGTVNLTRPHAFLVLAELVLSAGEEAAPFRERLIQRHKESLDAALAAHAIDENQDGNNNQDEGWRNSVILVRA